MSKDEWKRSTGERLIEDELFDSSSKNSKSCDESDPGERSDMKPDEGSGMDVAGGWDFSMCWARRTLVSKTAAHT